MLYRIPKFPVKLVEVGGGQLPRVRIVSLKGCGYPLHSEESNKNWKNCSGPRIYLQSTAAGILSSNQPISLPIYRLS